MQFGIFDWLDESGRDLGRTYEERLRMLELADRSGFYAYHLAEHHGTELSTVPSPHLLLAAASQRTRQIRLGPLSVILPMYEPVRLLEEIAMLDQLTNGRFDLGLSRGSTGEHVENDPAKAREMFHEELQIILKGLATGDIDFHGKHYQYDHAFTRLKPVQTPYPPLWYPTSNLDSIPWIAANGMNAVFSVHLKPSFDDTAAMVRRYRELYEAHRNDADRLNAHVSEPKYGFSLHVHVAETDAQALAQAQPAYDAFIHNYTYRWVRRGAQARYDRRPTFEEERAEGKIAVGAPETVARQLSDYVKRSGANYVIGVFAFGNLPVEQVLSSVSLFARDVMPALSAAEADAVVGV